MGSRWKSFVEGRQGIVGASLILIAATFLSKFLGFARTILIAGFFGASGITDAFYIALSLGMLIAPPLGNAARTAIVAIFPETGDEESRRRYFSSVFSVVMLIGIVVAALSAALAGPIVDASTQDLDADTRTMATLSLQLLGIWIIWAILRFTIDGCYEAGRNFLVPSIFDLLLIIVITGLLVGLVKADVANALPISWALGSGLLLVAYFLVYASRFRYRPTLASPLLSPTLKMIAPLLIGAVLYNVIQLLDRVMATGLAEGSASAIFFAFQVMFVPIHFLVQPASRAALPYLSGGGEQQSGYIVERLVHFTFILMIPICLYTVFRAEPLVRLMFERNAFDASDTLATSQALLGFVPGMLPMAWMMIFSIVLYARKKAGTVAIALTVATVVKVVVSLLLRGPLGLFGISLGTSAAFLAAMLIITAALGREKRRTLWTPILGSSACSAFALGAVELLPGIPFVIEGILYVALFAGAYLLALPKERAFLADFLRSARSKPASP